ncbi:hypothetical protein GOP47_0029071 [Adiantum capillus-veneris]|nr:hypothetical protein GOP47_0029071 [Adiantum capillus-veneris]
MGVQEVSWKGLQLTGLPPSPREAHLLVALDAHRLLLLGGGAVSPAFGPQQFNDTFVLDLKEGKWSYLATTGDQPTPRTGTSAVVLDDQRVLLFGGSSMLEGYMNDVFILDTKNWAWSRFPVRGLPPSPRDKHTACLLGSKMYVFGGFGPSLAPGREADTREEQDQDGPSPHSDTDAMSASGDESTEEEDDDDDNNDEATMSFTWFNDLHVFDLTSMEWLRVETKGAKPSPRAAHAAFIVKTLEWKKEVAKSPPCARSFHSMGLLGESQLSACYGGVGIHGEMFPGLELLNVETMEWTLVKSRSGAWPPLRGASAMVARHSKEACEIIIFGGSCSMENRDTVFYNDCYTFDASSLLHRLSN